ncbi:MAG: hypothetical protein JXQ87_17190 [Bacteroidia bacterium]
MDIIKCVSKGVWYRFALVICLCSGVTGYAQNTIWTNEYVLESRLSTPEFIGVDDDNIICYTEYADQFYVECYNRTHNYRCYRNKVLFSDIGIENVTVKKVVYLDSSIWACGWSYGKRNNKYQVHLARINPKTGRFIDSSQKVLLTQIVSSSKEVGDFDLIFSPNQKRVLLYHIRTDEKHDLIIKNFRVLNTGFDEIESKTLELPKAEYNDLGPKFIDDFGSIYGLELSDDKIVNVVSYDIEGNLNERKELINIDYNSEKAYITNVKAGVSPNNEFVVVGFYLTKMPSDNSFKSEIKPKYYKWKIRGAIFFKKKNVLAKGNVELSLFEFKFFDKLRSFYNTGQGKGIMYNEYSNEKLLFNGSDLFFLSERKYMQSARDYLYTFLDQVVVLKFDNDGKLSWTQVVAKRQKITDKVNVGVLGSLVPDHYSNRFLSYSGFIVDNELYIVFNDRKENAEIIQLFNIEKPFGFGAKALAVEAKLNIESGVQTKQARNQYKSSKFYFVPSATHNFQGEKLLLFINQKNYSYKIGWQSLE